MAAASTAARVSFSTLEVESPAALGPPSLGPPSATARNDRGHSWTRSSFGARQSGRTGQRSLTRHQSVEQLVDQGHRRSEASQIAVREAAVEALESAFVNVIRCFHFLMMLCHAGYLFGLGYAAYSVFRAEDLSCGTPLVECIFVLYCILFAIGFKRSTLKVLLWPHDPEEGDVACPVCCYGCILNLCLIVWPFVTTILWAKSTPCSRTVNDATELLLILSGVAIGCGLVLPWVFICVVVSLARRGAISAPQQGAPEGFMDELPVIDFNENAAHFNDDAAGGFGSSCAICMTDFDASNTIVRTPCQGTERGHAFHKDCLAGWMRMARTCPLCRTDLVQTIHTAQQGLSSA